MKIMWFFLGILYLICGVVYLYREIKFIKKESDLLLISYARLMYCLTFGIIPALLCFMYVFQDMEVKLKTLVAVSYSTDGLIYLYIFWLLSVIGYIALNVGYQKKYRLRIGNHYLLKADTYEMSELQSFSLASICLVIGIVSLYLWTKNEGNIFNFIVKANWYRADYTNSQNNTYAMFKQPAKLVQVSTYLFFFYVIRNKCKHKILFLLGYIAAFASSVLYLLCTDGRLAIALFFGMQLIGVVLYRSSDIKITRKQIYIIAIVAVAALISISKLDDITYFIRYGHFNTAAIKEESNSFITIMNEFGYIYESGQMSIEHNIFLSGRWMILDDIVRGIFSCFPSRFTPDGFERVWRWNTYLCTGSTLAGTIPCDIISESIYDLGLLGPVIVPYFWGKLMKYIEVYFGKKKSVAFNRACYTCLALAFFRIINYCELYDFTRGLFAFLIMWLLSRFIRKVSF